MSECGRCKNCKWWGYPALTGTIVPGYELPKSACDLTEVVYGRVIHGNSLALGHYDGWSKVTTKAEFGCVQWEAVE